MGSPGLLRQALKLPLFSIFAQCRLLTNNFRSNVCFSCGLKARPRGPVERAPPDSRLSQYGFWQSVATKRTRLPCICTSTCGAVALIAGLPRVACLELPPTAPVSRCLLSLCDLLHTGMLPSPGQNPPLQKQILLYESPTAREPLPTKALIPRRRPKSSPRKPNRLVLRMHTNINRIGFWCWLTKGLSKLA